MDDSLDSVRDNQMAIQLFEELQGLWAKAGMKARKWLSNSPEVLTVIPQELRAYEINLKDGLPKRSPHQERLSESLSPEEIENAEILIIHEAQQAAFTEEDRALQENKSISKKSHLKTLVPLLDEDVLTRCDGRLRFAELLPYDM